MAKDSISDFLMAPITKRLEMAVDSNLSESLKTYLGEKSFAEYQNLARQTLGRQRVHLGGGASQFLIFVPGVMGSLLLSRKKGGVWWIDARTRHHLNDLQLTADGYSDADLANDVIPCTTDPGYEPF